MRPFAYFLTIVLGLTSTAFADSMGPLPCAQGSAHPLCRLAQETPGAFEPDRLPPGYVSQSLDEEASQPLLGLWQDPLQILESEALTMWENYVEAEWASHQAGEHSQFEFESESDKDFFKANPQLSLGLPTDSPLNTWEGLYRIFRRGRLIGYALELNRQVRAEIIQDGAGLVLYFNLQGTLVALTEWDS